MNDAVLAAITRSVAEATKEHIGQVVAPLLERIAALEAREPTRGEKGERGERGERGDPGEPGPRGEVGDRGRDGVAGAEGASGRDGVDGLAGPQGERGETGERGEKGDAGPQGESGRDGADGVAGARGEPGLVGEKGEPGRDGRDGQEGIPGRDAVEIQILPNIDFARAYPRGTYATHKGGLWHAFETTEAERGWENIVRGLANVEVIQDEDDEQLERTVVTFSDGDTKCFERRSASPVWSGSYQRGKAYQRGQMVAFGGSAWICKAPTSDAPGTESEAWGIFARRGKDGKDGEKGERGDRGGEGRAGRDLTQKGPDGTKW